MVHLPQSRNSSIVIVVQKDSALQQRQRLKNLKTSRNSTDIHSGNSTSNIASTTASIHVLLPTTKETYEEKIALVPPNDSITSDKMHWHTAHSYVSKKTKSMDFQLR
jgi:hypothetical protein